MRTLIVFLIAVMFTLEYSYSQTFENEQAKKIFEQGEGAVNLPTGKMSYRQHLYTLNQDGYQLPISLIYSSNGLRLDESSGWYGLGWNLSAGGVVTRKVRDKPDEKPYGKLYGSIYDRWHPHIDNIDGETDFFYASLEGRQVAFVLECNESKEVVAKCSKLENIRIKVEMNSNKEVIESFIITDEKGVSYYFTEVEYTVLAYQKNIQGGFSTSIGFPSAWYLSKISPPSGRPIYFEYYDALRKEYSSRESFYSISSRIESVNISELKPTDPGYSLSYWDFYDQVERERRQFMKEMEMNTDMLFASQEEEEEEEEEERKKRTLLKEQILASIETSVSLHSNSLELYNGYLALKKTAGLTRFAEGCEEYARHNGGVKSGMSYFLDPLEDDSYANIASTIINDLCYSTNSSSSTWKTIEDQAIYQKQNKQKHYLSKVLKQIKTSNEELAFVLEDDGWSTRISGIQIDKITQGVKHPTCHISFRGLYGESQARRFLLKSIQKHYYSSSLKDTYEFTYYREKEFSKHLSGMDWWGYYNGFGERKYFFGKRVNNLFLKRSYLDNMRYSFYGGIEVSGEGIWSSSDDHSKMFMLKEVSLTGGGKIQFEYERNRVSVGEETEELGLPFSPATDSILAELPPGDYPAGGLRLKQQKTIVGEDTLVTQYNYRGGYLDPTAPYRNVEDLRTDIVYHPQALARDKIPVFSSGNSGVWYSWVQVTKSGAGSIVYKYPYLAHYKLVESFSRFLEVGNFLLEQYTFDKTGALVNCKKNDYIFRNEGTNNEAKFIPEHYLAYCFFYSSEPYSGGLDERKRDPYYIDKDLALSAHLDCQEELGRFNGFIVSHNPRRDVYNYNIAPRLNQNLEILYYHLPLEMDIRLLSQREVSFDSLVVQDQYSFTMAGFSSLLKNHSDKMITSFKTEYIYDYPHLTAPTKIIKDLGSHAEVTQIKYLDSYNKEPYKGGVMRDVFVAMRDKNMVHIPLQQEVYRLDNNNKKYCQVSGTQTEYKYLSRENITFVVPDKTYSLEQIEPVWHSSEGLDLKAPLPSLVNPDLFCLQEEFFYHPKASFPLLEQVNNHQSQHLTTRIFDIENNRLGFVGSQPMGKTVNNVVYRSLERVDLEHFDTSYLLSYQLNKETSSDILLILDGDFPPDEIAYTISFENGTVASNNLVSLSRNGGLQGMYRIQVDNLLNFQSISHITFTLPFLYKPYSALVMREDHEQVFKAYSYDMDGNRISEYNESLHGVHLTYDKKRRVLSQRDHEYNIISSLHYSIVGENEIGLSVQFAPSDYSSTSSLHSTWFMESSCELSIYDTDEVKSMNMSIFTSGFWWIKRPSPWIKFSSSMGKGNEQITLFFKHPEGEISSDGEFFIRSDDGLILHVWISHRSR